MSRSRNTKHRQKPDKAFKKVKKRKRKAKEKAAFRNTLDEAKIPQFKKTDTWDWN